MFQFEDYTESADYIKSRLQGFSPAYLLILGSGLGVLAEQVQNPMYIPYSDIPYFRTSTAPSHAGRFVCGLLGDKPVMIMQGRMHMYEGYTAEETAYPVRVAKLLGASTLIITNASGGINLEYKPGDLVALNDFIRFSFPNPLIGVNIPEFGPRDEDTGHIAGYKHGRGRVGQAFNGRRSYY